MINDKHNINSEIHNSPNERLRLSAVLGSESIYDRSGSVKRWESRTHYLLQRLNCTSCVCIRCFTEQLIEVELTFELFEVVAQLALDSFRQLIYLLRKELLRDKTGLSVKVANRLFL